jgi:hypothetical protein
MAQGPPTTAGGSDLLWPFSRKYLYNPLMNKRAKKRLKESIEKENQKRAEIRKDQTPSPGKEYQVSRGFTPKPDKKRG